MAGGKKKRERWTRRVSTGFSDKPEARGIVWEQMGPFNSRETGKTGRTLKTTKLNFKTEKGGQHLTEFNTYCVRDVQDVALFKVELIRLNGNEKEFYLGPTRFCGSDRLVHSESGL